MAGYRTCSRLSELPYLHLHSLIALASCIFTRRLLNTKSAFRRKCHPCHQSTEQEISFLHTKHRLGSKEISVWAFYSSHSFLIPRTHVFSLILLLFQPLTTSPCTRNLFCCAFLNGVLLLHFLFLLISARLGKIPPIIFFFVLCLLNVLPFMGLDQILLRACRFE